jgi:hypothetical protein
METEEKIQTTTAASAFNNPPKITYFDKLCGIRDGKQVYFIVDGVYYREGAENNTVELLDLELRKIIVRPYEQIQELIRSGQMKSWSPERSRFLEGKINTE